MTWRQEELFMISCCESSVRQAPGNQRNPGTLEREEASAELVKHGSWAQRKRVSFTSALTHHAYRPETRFKLTRS